MKFAYHISLEDWREAQRLMGLSLRPSRSKLARGIRTILFLIIIFILGVSVAELGNIWLKVGIVASLLILPRLGSIFFRYQIDQRYKQNPWMQREFIADLHDDRLEVDDGAGAQRSETWDHFDRFREGKRVFVIGGSSRIFTIISKAQMSEDEQSFVRQLLPRVIPQI